MLIFTTDILNLQMSHNGRETFLLFCRTVGTADPVATLNMSCCSEITASLFGFASKPQRLLQPVQGQETGGEIFWGFLHVFRSALNAGMQRSRGAAVHDIHLLSPSTGDLL